MVGGEWTELRHWFISEDKFSPTLGQEFVGNLIVAKEFCIRYIFYLPNNFSNGL